jgi:hypothetical protein
MSPQEQHQHATLFPERAFVVQFTTDTQVEGVSELWISCQMARPSS